VSEQRRLPNAVGAVIEQPVKEAVHEALAEASVTVVTDDPGAESWRDADGAVLDDEDTETDAEDEDGSTSSDDGDSRSRRRRGLLGLTALVPLAALAAFAQYRRKRGASDDGDEDEREAEHDTTATDESADATTDESGRDDVVFAANANE
jgi:hypothetical protein